MGESWIGHSKEGQILEATGVDMIDEAVNNRDDPETLTEIVTDTGKGMKGDANADLPEEEQLQGRGV